MHGSVLEVYLFLLHKSYARLASSDRLRNEFPVGPQPSALYLRHQTTLTNQRVRSISQLVGAQDTRQA